MFHYTDTKRAPWYVVELRRQEARPANVISHLLSVIPYEDLTPKPFKLPPRREDKGYMRPPYENQTFVPEIF